MAVPLRAWSSVPYLPMLSLRPAEMRALEELPNLTKDRLMPIVSLRPWVGAHQLESAIDRIAEAYGERPVVVAMGEREPLPQNDRPVHAELNALRESANGFRHWLDFMREHPNYIPAMQFSPNIKDEEKQISQLFGLARGLVVVVEAPLFPALPLIAQRVGQRTKQGQDVCFVIDFALDEASHQNFTARATSYVQAVRQHAPSAYVAFSDSSFPDGFVGLTNQQIHERGLFNSLNEERLIYSDRGSARVERQSGGGGKPAPRIDYPLRDEWKFYREEKLEDFEGYRKQARRLIDDKDVWNPNFRVWGTQMIERTAAGDTSAIGGAQKATAARINLHLQRQAFYADPDAAEITDEDWSG